jgi:tRNA A-37 threonylcarbamoyl transferase component Bud32
MRIRPYCITQLEQLLMTVVQLHACDVVHRDLHVRNVLLYWSKENSFNFVIVDFGLASSIRYNLKMDWDWILVETVSLEELLEEELDFETVSKWMKTENGKRLLDLVEKNPDEIDAMRASGAL